MIAQQGNRSRGDGCLDLRSDLVVLPRGGLALNLQPRKRPPLDERTKLRLDLFPIASIGRRNPFRLAVLARGQGLGQGLEAPLHLPMDFRHLLAQVAHHQQKAPRACGNHDCRYTKRDRPRRMSTRVLSRGE